ncbi:MAG: MFS transporter [Candidatus Yonathbacteria bacterium]|nr:MFS transporter [Candidatus Yonathbacteria bacterium]
MQTLHGKLPFLIIYLASFLYALHYALPLYVASTFIGEYVREETVGMIYALGSLVTMILFFNMPRILSTFGNYRITLVSIVLGVISLLGLAIIESPLFLIPVFIFNQIILNVIYLNLNVFLEAYSTDGFTGSIRGMFLTILNIAILIAPFLAGMMFTDHQFRNIYFAAALILAPIFFLIYFTFKDYQDPFYKHVPLWATLREVSANKNIYGAFVASFLLNFFYTWMIIYIPLYLYKTLGISLREIVGIITPIALIPFVLFQVIMGRLADNKWGEQEMLIGGFVVMAITTAGLAFVTSTNIYLWALLLFCTRIGASAVETMSETYFFKQVDGTDTHLITLFRNLPPLSFLIGPIVATMLLTIFNIGYNHLFLVLGILMLLGVYYGLSIKDTR